MLQRTQNPRLVGRSCSLILIQTKARNLYYAYLILFLMHIVNEFIYVQLSVQLHMHHCLVSLCSCIMGELIRSIFYRIRVRTYEQYFKLCYFFIIIYGGVSGIFYMDILG